MEKKHIKSVLAAALCASVTLAGCGSSEPAATTTTKAAEAATTTAAATEAAATTTTTAAATEATAPAVSASSIPDDYKYYFSFDEPDDRVHLALQDKTATPIVQAADGEPDYVNGVKGSAVYVNGARGIKLDVNGVGDTYTVSYWVRSERSANYMPTLQYGPDIHGDSTGGQHYVNFTWADWNPDGAAFPCVWAYDELDEKKWPNWYPDEANTHVSEWCNITLTVDPNELSDDGTLIKAHLYFNGEELLGFDSDKNIRPTYVVSGTMSPSDNFDFLLGVNYWDAIMKGAFDEVYVYDYVLDAGQVKALYEAGDPTAKYDAPTREVVVTPDENAIESLGTVDFNLPFWTNWSGSTELKDGETKVVKLKNWSDGVNNWDNYIVLFGNTASEAGTDPNLAEGHVEYAAVRADAYGWLDGDGGKPIDAAAFNYNWGNWNTWLQQVMTEADVVLKISRNGSEITVNATNTDYLGSPNVCTATFEIAAGADDPVYFSITGEACYIDILSVTDEVKIAADPNAIASIGNLNYTNGWWTEWSEAYEIKNGETKNVHFKNYSDGKNNWDNYVFVFTNEYTPGGTADPNAGDGHVEYAAVRSDIFGWGDDAFNSSAAYEASWEDWGAWLEAMMNADVNVEIVRTGSDIVMNAVITDKNGVQYTSRSSFSTSAGEDDPMFFFITCEECYIDILSVD